jgi:hypothetical protein
VFDTSAGQLYGHGGNNEGFTSLSGILLKDRWGFVIFTNENQANDFTLGILGILLGAN